jgi:hypothetical protein
MTDMHLSSASRARRDRCSWVAVIVVSAGSWFGGEAIAQAPITAVHKAQELAFDYRGSGDALACHELPNRIARILVAVGARDDIDVKVRNCDGFALSDDSMDPLPGRDRMPGSDDGMMTPRDRWGTSSRFGQSNNNRRQSVHVRVKLMMPVEVTPEILAEIEKDKSRRELVSRVTRNPAAAFNEPIIFAAQRQEVTLSSQTIRLEPEDCELLEHMSNQVFRRIGVRVVRRGFSCGSGESSRIAPRVTVEALLPTGGLMPLPDPEKLKTKPGTDSNTESGSAAPEPATEKPPEEKSPQ